MSGTQLLLWTCAECGLPVPGDTGYLAATYADINSGGPIRWTPLHDTCHPDDGAYSVDLRRLRTIAHVQFWTDHLSGKNWYRRSNWRAVLAHHGVDVTPWELPEEWGPSRVELPDPDAVTWP